MDSKRYKLSEIAEIRAGYSFRSTLITSPDGPAVIQMKDVSVEEGIIWSGVEDVLLPGREPALWVENDDVLFIARGNNNIAIHVTGVTEPTVCTPHFFHIRLDPKHSISAEFLAWQLNQGPCQRYFDIQSVGQGLRNIKRTTLENTPIAIPELATQMEVVNLYKLILEEEQTFEQLRQNRQLLLSSIAANL